MFPGDLGSYVQRLRKKFQDELAAASATAEESIGNIRTVRSFSQERKAMGNYGTDIDKSYKVGAKLALFSGTGWFFFFAWWDGFSFFYYLSTYFYKICF